MLLQQFCANTGTGLQALPVLGFSTHAGLIESESSGPLIDK